jgi:ubiquinone/menaquinone biosynthesis C-methylase UbiE
MSNPLRDLFFRIWYWYISSIDKKADVTFMNYGFSKDGQQIPLEEADEKDRYSVQLYHHVASGAPIKGQDILEVGSGRGGGLSYVNRYLKPKSATGLDLAAKAVTFSNAHYREGNIRFVQGDAQALPFEDESFDVVLNVESCHRYPRIDLFFQEVHRVLKPGGHLLLADLRRQHHLEEFDRQVASSPFSISEREDIRPHVAEALGLSSASREQIIHRLAPRFLHALAKNFAGTKGTPTYERFQNGYFQYVSYVLRK